MSTAMATRFVPCRPNVTGNFPTAGGVAHVDCVPQIKRCSEGREIVGVSIHLVTIPRLGRAAVASPVMRDDSIATRAEERHLCVPVVGSQGPTVAEHDWLSLSPVLVEKLRAVFGADRWHNLTP